MIYIAGHRFTVGAQKIVMRSGSIQEQLAMAKMKQHAPIENEGFKTGNAYQLLRIKKEELNKYLYIFQDLTSNTIIEKTFSSTTTGDDFIANVSGDREKLKAAREAIVNSYTASGL